MTQQSCCTGELTEVVIACRRHGQVKSEKKNPIRNGGRGHEVPPPVEELLVHDGYPERES